MLHNNYNFVDLVGVELEGGWNNPDFRVGHDGSVDVDADIIGELASPPLQPAEVEAWMTRHYPHALNSTCGLHTHVSFKSKLAYARVMEPAFYEFFLRELGAWGTGKRIRRDHPFWPRLRGENTFCKREFTPEQQVWKTGKASGRYTQLNYCYGLHKTVEARVLPGFKQVTVAIEAVLKVVNIFEDWLQTQPKRDRAVRSAAIIEIDETPEIVTFTGEIDMTPATLNLNVEV